LEETLPVVSAGIVLCILHGNYIDMAELSKENLEMELRRSADGGKPTPAHKLRPVPDLISWTRAFSHYAGIVV